MSGNDSLSSKRCISSLLPDVRRATSIRMLGVTLINHLSVSDHVRDVISRCTQSLHALKIMRCHGMSSDALKTVYKSVVLVKLLYSSPAWWGFATASDKGRIEAHVRRAVRLNMYRSPVYVAQITSLTLLPVFTGFVLLSASISTWRSLTGMALHLDTCLTFAALLTCLSRRRLYGRRLPANLMSARRVS